MSAGMFGIGAYTLAEAGRLLAVPPTRLRRWLFGYDYRPRGSDAPQAPLWRPQYGVDQDEPLLGFRDLLEARVVRGLREQGLGLPTIRAGLRVASEMVGNAHPFSTRLFRTDGRRLFLLLNEGDLVDLRRRQQVFRRIVEPSFRDLDYDTDQACRWWLSPKRTMVIDPTRAFGQPILAESGIPVATIARAAQAEGSAERAAALFEIKPAVVREAIGFMGAEGWRQAA